MYLMNLNMNKELEMEERKQKKSKKSKKTMKKTMKKLVKKKKIMKMKNDQELSIYFNNSIYLQFTNIWYWFTC